MKPYVCATTSAIWRAAQSSPTRLSSRAGSCVAITSVKGVRKSGRASRTSAMSSFTYEPATCSLSSRSICVTHSARGLPSDASSRKKLDPRSASPTVCPSTTVNEPIPGSTRFLSDSVPTALPLSRHTLHSSIASCPCAPQSRSWRSYRRRLAYEASDFISSDAIRCRGAAPRQRLGVGGVGRGAAATHARQIERGQPC